MKLIQESLYIDFVVDSKPLTEQEAIAISAFIKKRKSLSQKHLEVSNTLPGEELKTVSDKNLLAVVSET